MNIQLLYSHKLITRGESRYEIIPDVESWLTENIKGYYNLELFQTVFLYENDPIFVDFFLKLEELKDFVYETTARLKDKRVVERTIIVYSLNFDLDSDAILFKMRWL